MLLCGFVASSALAGEHGSALVVHDVNASFMDVQARRKELATATNPRVVEALKSLKTCTKMVVPLPPSDLLQIPARYVSGSHGAIDPKENEAAQPYNRLQELAARGADEYVASGDAKAAECVVDALDGWAKARTLTGYIAHDNKQLWYHAEWTIASLALSVSVVRQEPTLDQEKLKRVTNWLNNAVRKLMAEEDLLEKVNSSHNNHHYWRGLACAAVGVISKDDQLFQRGLGIYGEARELLNGEGAFPREMERHELAIHYQAFALEPLVMIAQLAWRQGYNIYATPAHGRTLTDGAPFLSRSGGPDGGAEVCIRGAGEDRPAEGRDTDFVGRDLESSCGQ